MTAEELLATMEEPLAEDGTYCTIDPETRIITETNVPHKDNISYFGNGGDEADLIYQFPLPPLVMYSLLKGDAAPLSEWIATFDLPSDRVTYFNFLSSHDGIGVRPVEGILDEEARQLLVDAALAHGGEVSYKYNGDGTKSPYELNINYQDALAGPDASDQERIGKFLAAETILLSLQGVPGIYIHSLLGSRNDYYGKTTSGIPRRINREKLDLGYVRSQLTGESNRARIFREMIRVIPCQKEVLALLRENQKTGSRVWALVNVSGKTQTVEIPDMEGMDLLGGDRISGKISLDPWACAWVCETR